MGLLREIRSDYRRYRATGARSWLPVVLLTQGFWASSSYRVARFLWRRVRLPVARQLLNGCSLMANKAVEIITGVSLPATCEVGEGLYIGHFGPIIVNGAARIGRNCNLSQGVTLGLAGRGEHRGCPTLGDRVYVGANAVIIGKVEVGHDAVVGAGAVVTRSVPPRGVAVGNPARVVSYRGSFDFVRYDGMHSDPERLASIAAAQASIRDGADA